VTSQTEAISAPLAIKERTITKLKMFLRAMRMPFVVGGGLAIVFFITISALSLGSEYHSNFEVFITVGLFALFIFLGFCLIGLFAPLQGLLLLNKQENELALSFDMEMLKRGVEEFDHHDKDWFISVKSDRIVVLNRKYLAKLEDFGEENRYLSRITVVSKTGKKHKVIGHVESIQGLLHWMGYKEDRV